MFVFSQHIYILKCNKCAQKWTSTLPTSQLVTLSHYRSTGEIWLSCRQGSAGKLFISFWKWKVRTSSKLYFREIVMHVNLILQDFGRKVASGSGKHYKLDGIRLMPTFIKTGLADIFTKERVLKILGPYWNALIVRWKFVNFSYKILYLRSTEDNSQLVEDFYKNGLFSTSLPFSHKKYFFGNKDVFSTAICAIWSPI